MVEATTPATDFILPFDLPKAGVRGRLVRLEEASTQALAPHPMKEPAMRTTGELIALVTLTGSLFKLDGRLTAQTKSTGPLNMAVADYYGAELTGGKGVGVRAYTRTTEVLDALGKAPSFGALTGDGVMAITVRPRADERDYQGITKLDPKGLAQSAEAYFSQSVQLETLVRLAAGPLYNQGEPEAKWRAAGLLLQVVPDDTHGPEDWERVSTLAATIQDGELLDADLSAETLLWRLFNQEEVRLLPHEAVSFHCGCDTDNIGTVLKQYSAEERAKLADEDGFIRAKCQFCGKEHAFAEKDFA